MIKNKHVIVAALEQEFPFKNEYNILYSGVGKINASISLLSYLHENPNINTVINVGTAAGVTTQKNTIVQCGIFIEGDLDYPGYLSETIIIDDSKLKLSTFDFFQKDIPKRECDCIDMEAFALAKICKLKKINFLCYKYVSDIIGEVNQEHEWNQNYQNGRFLLKSQINNII